MQPHSQNVITTASIMVRKSRKPQAHECLSTPPTVLYWGPQWEEWKKYQLTRALSLPLPYHHYILLRTARCYKVTSCDAGVGLRRASNFSLEEMQVTTQRRNSRVKWRMFTEVEGVLRETVGPLPRPCAWQIVFVYCCSQIIRYLRANMSFWYTFMLPRAIALLYTLSPCS